MIVTADPQNTVVTVLKAPTFYYASYQGAASDLPIALVPPDRDNQTGYDTYSALEKGAGTSRSELPTTFQRYMDVAKGSTLVVWFPRVGCIWGAGAGDKAYFEQSYTYTFHWRLRSVKDYRFSNNTPFSLVDRLSVTTFGGRLWVPSARGPVVTPTSVGEDLVPYYSSDGVASAQTSLTSSRFIGGTANYGPTFDDWYGDQYYEPMQIPCMGDQLLVTARRTNNELGTYDFGSPTKDAAFDITYGRSEYNTANPPGVGQDRSQAISPQTGLIIYTTNIGA